MHEGDFLEILWEKKLLVTSIFAFSLSRIKVHSLNHFHNKIECLLFEQDKKFIVSFEVKMNYFQNILDEGKASK